MQNIYITKHSENPIEVDLIVACCFNQLDNTFYICDKQNNIHQLLYDTASRSVKVQQTIPADPQLVGAHVIHLTYLIDSQSVSVVTEEGSIFKVTSKETQLVAQNQDGIYSASWSPSQDRLIIITKNNTLLQLNEQFNLDNQIPLNDTEEEGLGEKSRISWKPDGKFCTINFGIKGTQSRKSLVRDNLLNVFKSAAKPDPDPKGLVQSVSETPVVGLSNLVAWNPTGNIIAGVDSENGKFRVIFWEKNGLRHLEFNLQSWVKQVRDLVYSHDGQILYVEVITQQNTRELFLYHRANYHWYLKSSLSLREGDKYLLFKERRNQLFIIGESKFQFFQFSIKPCDWEWKSYENEIDNPNCIFYSIDGSRVLISDYNKSIIPPPMCLRQLKTDSRVLGSSKLGDSILLITPQTIYLYEHSQTGLKELTKNTIKQKLTNLRLIKTSPITFLIDNNTYTVNKDQIKIQKSQQMQSNIQRIKFQDTQVEVKFQLINSQLFVNGSLLCEQVTSYCLYDVFLLFTTSTSELYQKLYVFNLNIHSEIYEQTSATLLKKLQNSSLNMRNVQRGSRIITCSNGRCIFQLPRGNLQGIYPKTITLLNVKRAIKRMDYLKAFQAIRTHKLDMNLLFDLDPQQFLTNTQKLLSDIKKVDFISLLIASLKNQLSEQLRYCLSKQQTQKVENYFQINKNKIRTVCEVISNSLRSLDYEKYILAIMAAEVKRGELPKVLHEIKSIKSNDVVIKIAPHLTEQPKTKKPLNSKEILEYVCWMAEPETVYKAAFLTFDLELVAMAAEFTQKDPKQYLPYLEELKAMGNQIDKRAKICLDLKQPSQAIKQLALGNQEQKNQAIQLIKNNKLFKVGIQSFKTQKQHLIRIRSDLADYLINRDELNEAYNICISSGLLDKALQLSILRSDTSNVIDLMNHLKYPKEKIVETINKIVEKSVDNPSANFESLGLAYQYLEQYEEAFKAYIKDQNFVKIGRILKYLPAEFIESKVTENYKFLYSLKYNQTLSEIKLFNEKYLRLQNLQKMKRLTVNLVISTKEADEMYSQYSRASGQSKSNYTVSTTTGMKKKKQKVKGILTRNIKEGSPLQEDYLIALLGELITKSSNIIKSNKTMIQQLIYMNLLTEAQSLKEQTKIYIETVSKRIRPYKQIKYQEQHPDVIGVYPPYIPLVPDTLSSFDYMI